MCPFWNKYLISEGTFTGTVRRTVASGGFLQNPVATVASLCGPFMEVLSMKSHPLESFLSKEELCDVIERTMVTIVNQSNIIQSVLLSLHNWLDYSLWLSHIHIYATDTSLGNSTSSFEPIHSLWMRYITLKLAFTVSVGLDQWFFLLAKFRKISTK